MVTAFFPEAAPVSCHVFDAAQPFGALAAEEVRGYPAQWEAVFGGEELAVVVRGHDAESQSSPVGPLRRNSYAARRSASLCAVSNASSEAAARSGTTPTPSQLVPVTVLIVRAAGTVTVMCSVTGCRAVG